MVLLDDGIGYLIRGNIEAETCFLTWLIGELIHNGTG